MDEKTREATRYAGVGVGALLSLWLGIRLIEALVPLMGQALPSLFTVIGWAIILAGFIVVAILTVLMPLIVGAAVVVAFFWMLDAVARQIKNVRDDIAKLGQAISAQARDASIDAAVLAALALMAGLVFYMGTADFIEPFTKETSHVSHDHAVLIRVLAVAAAVASLSKMLFLIPVRSVKIIAMIIMLIAVAGSATIVIKDYVARVGLATAWDNIVHASVMTMVVMATSVVLLVTAVAYPFSPRAWGRRWRIESEQTAATRRIEAASA